MPEFYHVSDALLEPGVVLESRFVRNEFRYQYQVVQWALHEGLETMKSVLLVDYFSARGENPVLPMALKESIFEQTRLSEHPDRPSRLSSIFLCPTRREISQCSKSYQNPPHLYLCTVDDPGAFMADLTLASTTDPLLAMQRQLDALTERARRYWQGERHDNSIMEVLGAPGTVRVLTPVDW